ncbi:SGNH/GDSL hydrolase family protein [Flavihumibacter stibioxidans]|uniref:Hydrolase n=1 Tax=Flavihumibacter stibioxidans TaxID=1834163 RepID=A0ABR7M868_9BACT|nr:SGNH/GDSL hydrolase family protein [Flavihumibacter stibioxidans]MBC6491202.1 hypothetical protein [Flavihumibacter stibioxidans]
MERVHNYLLTTLVLLVAGFGLQAQVPTALKWWDPLTESTGAIGGRGWTSGLESPYDRLPAKAEAMVRKEVWSLSRQSAGLFVRFRSDAKYIVVRYAVNGALAMNHMPATGVSGIDLYARDASGNWNWAPGNFRFGDTIIYTFSNLRWSGKEADFHLYLPLYNSVKWLQVGVPESNLFQPLPATLEKPVVVYGTSIAQGGCASRPGLAWTNILERRLGKTVINLGFSGNGRLEDSVLHLLAEIDAAVYVLDCIPNLTTSSGPDGSDLKNKIRHAVKVLRSRRPGVPIILTEHSGGTAAHFMDSSRQELFRSVSLITLNTYNTMKTAGVDNIYHLSSAQINLTQDGTVDGVHPNDIGMMSHAIAYEKLIRAILSKDRKY